MSNLRDLLVTSNSRLNDVILSQIKDVKNTLTRRPFDVTRDIQLNPEISLC